MKQLTLREVGTIYSKTRKAFLAKYRIKGKPWIDYGASVWSNEMTREAKEFYRMLLANKNENP